MRAEIDYQDLSRNYLHVFGSHWDNDDPDYTAAYHAARGIFTHSETLTNDPTDDFKELRKNLNPKPPGSTRPAIASAGTGSMASSPSTA